MKLTHIRYGVTSIEFEGGKTHIVEERYINTVLYYVLQSRFECTGFIHVS